MTSRSQRGLRLAQYLLPNLRVVGVLCEDLVADVDCFHKPEVRVARGGAGNRPFTARLLLSARRHHRFSWFPWRNM